MSVDLQIIHKTLLHGIKINTDLVYIRWVAFGFDINMVGVA